MRITELMYHPAEEGEALEFIELQNIAEISLDLSGYYFRGIGLSLSTGNGRRTIADHRIDSK